MRPWCSFAISAYCCYLISKTKTHPAIWQNFSISSRLPHFVSLSCLVFPESHRASLNLNLSQVSVSEQSGRISPFSHPPVEWSMHTPLNLQPSASLLLRDLPPFTLADFFNKTYYNYLTSSSQKKASKQIGWEYFSHDFPRQKHTQMEMMAF